MASHVQEKEEGGSCPAGHRSLIHYTLVLEISLLSLVSYFVRLWYSFD
uniref:Uncharacterized protein n=1 Tax=Arundo donax TaxID=35708 RepID=A0A0A8Y9R3_ARUDO